MNDKMLEFIYVIFGKIIKEKSKVKFTTYNKDYFGHVKLANGKYNIEIVDGDMKHECSYALNQIEAIYDHHIKKSRNEKLNDIFPEGIE